MGEVDKQSVKKKVLFLLEAFDKGGIEKVTLDIVNHLDPEKYDITVQTFWYGGHCQSLVNENVRVIPFFFKRYVRGIIRLIQYLPPKVLYALFVHGNYDVEIAASDGGAAKVISGSTNTKAKKVCWVHMDVVERGSKLKEFRNAKTARKIYGKFDQISCVSKNCLAQFVKKFGKYDCMNVAHNPLPVEMIKKLALEECPYSQPDEKIRLVSVGRLAVEKGYDRLIYAAEKLHKEGYNNFCIYIVGDGGLKATLQELIDRLNMQSTIILEGFSPNPYPYIKNADFFICSSTDEAYPLVIGESLILNTPVISTECAGTTEWLGDNEFGLLVENSTEGIYNGIKQICLNHHDMKQKWTDAAIKKAGKMTMESQMNTWVAKIITEENSL